MNDLKLPAGNTSGGLSPLEVSCGIIIQSRKILCAKRKPGTAGNRWEFPGGKVEPGETHKQAVIRELEEELGVHVEILYAMTMLRYCYPHLDLHLSPFICRIVQNSPHPIVHEEIRWVRPEDLKNLDWLEANRILLSDLETVLKRNPGLLGT